MVFLKCDAACVMIAYLSVPFITFPELDEKISHVETHSVGHKQCLSSSSNSICRSSSSGCILLINLSGSQLGAGVSEEYAVRRHEGSGNEGDKNITVLTGNQKAFRVTCGVQRVTRRSEGLCSTHGVGCVPFLYLHLLRHTYWSS